ncbi:putative ABC transport system ATP-binding protein [Stackebrandtia albiflava]|uniref:Putative ABC transport system ATP-binding protein n=1 Tax=Stackebrandtia albiflava TaxID=406432 RepID=A0A562VEN7_9ACTN|nr:ABC transporter ATP-binding protein [Stackebrandtia albiflava]TWJ16291.1 putative ABC transport system ATP-binding protein [Stackebrandtia albiflava]
MTVSGTTEAPAGTATAIRLDGVCRRYRDGDRTVTALDAVDLRIPVGRFTAVMGPSGSGKSTLLHCASGLDTPTSGTIRIGDTEITGMRETARTRLRRERVGFVFQSYNLMPSLTIGDNITLPLRLADRRPDHAWLHDLIGHVGLRGLLNRRPSELSGGQQQRAALARALVARPDVVFADEPTGALDLRTAAEVLDLFGRMVSELGQTIVMVTHDPVAAARADVTVVMSDGRIADTLARPSAERLAHRLARLERGAA